MGAVYLLGAGRCRRIGLRPSTVYYMGSSTSPDRIHVVDVDDDWITVRSWPFGPDKTRRMERPVADALISAGTTTRRDGLRRYVATCGTEAPRWAVREIERLSALLDGRPVEPSELTDDWRVRVVAQALVEGPNADVYPERGGDPWYAAETYGSVAGRTRDDGGMDYRIEGTVADYARLVCDPRFRVLSVEPMWSDGPTLDAVMAERKARRNAALAEHAKARGTLCRDDGLGCCAVCGVELCVCDTCGGTGYHRRGCADSDEPRGLAALLAAARASRDL